MKLGAYEIALIGIGGTVCGALLGAYITYYFSTLLAERNERQTAIGKLRAAFVGELAAIRLAHSDIEVLIEIYQTIAGPIMRQAAAIEEFRPFLDISKQKEYQEAWQKYYNFASSVYSHGDQNERNILAPAKEMIESILKFANVD